MGEDGQGRGQPTRVVAQGRGRQSGVTVGVGVGDGGWPAERDAGGLAGGGCDHWQLMLTDGDKVGHGPGRALAEVGRVRKTISAGGLAAGELAVNGCGIGAGSNGGRDRQTKKVRRNVVFWLVLLFPCQLLNHPLIQLLQQFTTSMISSRQNVLPQKISKKQPFLVLRRPMYLFGYLLGDGHPPLNRCAPGQGRGLFQASPASYTRRPPTCPPPPPVDLSASAANFFRFLVCPLQRSPRAVAIDMASLP